MATAALELLLSIEDRASSGLEAISGKLTSFGTLAAGGALALTGAVVGIGAAAFDAASQVAQGANDMQAALGVTADRANELANLGEDIWANNWGGSIEEVNAALMETQKQFAGLGGIANDQAQQIVQSAFAISDTFGVDVNEAISAQRTLMEQFGVTSQQAADLVTTGFQQGLNSSDDFLDTIGEYSNLFAAGGADAAQFFSLIQSGMGSGVLGTDKAADAFKEFGIRIRELPDNIFGPDGALLNGLDMSVEQVDQLFYGLQDGSVTVADAFNQIMPALQGMDNEVYRNTIGVQLFGTQWEDLGPTIAANMGMGSTSLNDMAGATDSLNAKYNNWPSLWEGIKRSALDALLPLGTTLLGVANQVMPAVSSALSVIGPMLASAVSQAVPIIDTVVRSIMELIALFTGFNAATFDTTDSFRELLLALGLTNTQMEAVDNFIYQLSIGFQSALTAIQPFADLIGANLMPILAAIGTVVGGVLLSGLLAAAGAFVALVAPIAGIVAGLALLYAAFNSNFLGIQTIVTTVLGVVLGIVQSVGAQIVSFWTAYGAQIMAAAQAAWSGLQGLISSVLQGVVNVVVAIGGQIVAFWQQNGASIMATVQTTWAQLGTIISGAIQIITTIITALSGVVSTVFSTIANFISQNTASIQAVLTGAWQVIQGVITAAMGIISGVIKTVLSAIQGDWRGVWEGLKTIVTSAVSGIGSILQGLGNIVRGALGVLGGIIKDIASSMATQALAIGKSIIDGLIKGIKNGIGSVISAAKSMAESVYKAAMGALDSHSPSKLFAKVGDTIPAGMSVGITAGMPKVEKNLINGIAGLSESAAKALDAGTKAISAAASYSGPGGSGLSGFLAAFADLAIQFNDAAIALGGRILGTATRFAETIGKVAGSIGPAVEGLEALQTFVAPSRNAMLAFTAAMGDILTMFKEVAYALTDGAIKDAARFAESAGKVLGVIEVGAKAIASLADLPTLAPGTTQTFANKVAWIVSRFAEVGAWMNGSALSNAATFAEGAGKVLAMVGTGVDAFAKLNTFVKPIDGVVQLFTNKVTWLITRFAEVGAWMRGPILSAAVAFADGASKVLGILETGVAGFAALNTFVKPLPGITQAFTTAVYWLITRFVEAGAGLRGQGLAAAAAFADAAGKITGMIGGAVDAFAKLREFVAPAQSTVAAFGAALRTALATLIGVMKSFTADAITAAGAFGEGAGKAVAFIGSAVDGFTKLADFQGVGQAAIAAFGVALRATLQNLIGVMNGFAADAIAAAGKFGDGAGKAVSFIGNAVGSFIKLAEFTGVGQAAIDAFGVGLRATLAALVVVAQSFATEAVAAAAAFGEGAGKAVAFIGSAVDSLAKLADFKAPADDAVSAFFLAIGDLMERMDSYSVYFNDRMYAATKAFADGVHGAIANLGSIAESMAKLSDFKAPAEKAISAFFLAIGSLMEMMDSYSVYFNERMYATTKAFVDGVRGAIGNLGSIAESMSKLVDFEAPADTAVRSFLRTIGGIMEMLDSMSGDINTRMIASTIAFTGGIKAVIGQLQGALQAFATLGETSGSGKTVTAMMQSLQSLVTQMNAYLPPNALIIGQNTVIGLINGIVSQRGALVTAMVATVMAAVNAARTTLGIASPSKVFEQIGQYAGAGLQGGMSAMQPAIATAGAGLGMAAVGGAQPATRASGSGRGGDIAITIENMNVPAGRGPLTERELRQLAAYIKDELASERGAR